MVAAIRQTVTVQPDGRIEIRSPELRPGAQADVIVLVDDGRGLAGSLSQLDALKQLQAQQKLTPESARLWVEQSRAERQAWGNHG